MARGYCGKGAVGDPFVVVSGGPVREGESDSVVPGDELFGSRVAAVEDFLAEAFIFRAREDAVVLLPARLLGSDDL